MRPLTLEFSGLRSYRRAASIDFNEYELFAIIGDTGAGKSTVIEALSFALYARKTSGGTKAGLIADGQNTLTITLTFASGLHEWEVTRTRHRNASAPVDRLVCPATGEKVDGANAVSSRVAEVIGLTHDQFVRAVVMPQGKFDLLLTSTPADRNKILRSIFGLGVLERMKDLVRAERDRWATDLAVHRDRRKALPSDPSAELASAVAALAEVSTSAEALATDLAAAEEASTRLTIEPAVERLRDAMARVPTGLDDELERLRSALEAGHRLHEERAAIAQARDVAVADLETAEAERLALLDGLADRDAVVAQAESVAAAVATLTRSDEEAAACDADEEALADVVDPAVRLRPFQLAKAETEGALDDARRARDRAAERPDALARLRDDVAAHDATADSVSAALDAAQRALSDADELAAAANAHHAAALETLGQARAAADAARDAHAVAGLARDHEPGDPCPVCARPLPHSFAASPSPDLDAARSAVVEAEDAVADAAAELQRAISAVEVARTVVGRAEQDQQSVDEAASALAARAEALGADADLVAALADAEQRLTDAEALLASAVEAAAIASEAAVVERSLIDAETAARAVELERLGATRSSISERRDEARAVLGQLPNGWTGEMGDDLSTDLRTIEHRLRRAAGQLAELDQTTRDLERRVQEAKQRMEAINAAAAEQVTNVADSALGDVGRYADAVEAVIAASRVLDPDLFDPPDAVLPALPRNVQTAELPAAIATVEAIDVAASAARETAAAACDERASSLGSWRAQLDGVVDRHAVTSIVELRSIANEATTASKLAERSVVEAQQAVTDAAASDAVLGVAEPLDANLRAVQDALSDRSGRFVDHLVGRRERELLGEATKRLEVISGGRYGFVADFGIVDRASGEVRAPEALSGGERFQAALALALALVEIASRGAGQLDAVFVDEGFGSLDASALSTALDTLGKVAGEGKMVGLISHLRPVAEYVDTVLHVTKDDTEGSRIAPLDPEARELLLDDDARSGLTS